jgi:hypothetical protein
MSENDFSLDNTTYYSYMNNIYPNYVMVLIIHSDDLINNFCPNYRYRIYRYNYDKVYNEVLTSDHSLAIRTLYISLQLNNNSYNKINPLLNMFKSLPSFYDDKILFESIIKNFNLDDIDKASSIFEHSIKNLIFNTLEL